MTCAVVAADRREVGKKSVNKRLRSKGRIPAVLYGKKAGNQVIWIDGKQIAEQFRVNGEHVLFQVSVGGEMPHKVMVKEVQRDPLNQNEILHIDLYQIDEHLPVDTVVALEMTGEPPGQRQGGILQQQLKALHVRVLPERVPPRIPVPLDNLKVGDSLYVKDLRVAEWIEVKNDADELVVTVLEARQQDDLEEEAREQAEQTSATEETEV